MPWTPATGDYLCSGRYEISDRQGETNAEAKKKNASASAAITKLILKGKLTDAAEQLDAAIAEDAENASLHSLRPRLASAFSRKRNYKGAAEQYSKKLEADLANPKSQSAQLSSSVSMLRLYLPRAGRADELLPLIERTEAALSDRLDSAKPGIGVKGLLRIHNLHAMTLATNDDKGAADKLLRTDLTDMTALHEKHDTKLTGELKALALQNLFISLSPGDERRELFAAHQTLVRELIENGNISVATNFMSAGMSQVSRAYRSDSEYASEVLASLKSFLEDAKDDKELSKRISYYARSIKSYESRIEAAKAIAKMIGQPAPELDSDLAWVGTDGPLDLSGKVVLIDFWAVWCGPCVATFPHLQHLNEAYGDKGLQILGVTRYYNYTWNDDTNKAVRGERGADPDPKAEHEALQNFLASHNLKHPTVVVQKGSEMHKSFKVTGIPHAVLIDQKGNVQMVKIGSSKQNGEDLEAKIRDLLNLSKVTAE